MRKKQLSLVLALVMPLLLSSNMVNAQSCNHCKSNCKTQNAAPIVDKDGIVTIGAIPTTEAEFDALQARLGTAPEGCIALQLVAMEMYKNDPKVGAACLKKNNTSTNYMIVEGRLKELYRKNDSYARMHLVATSFNGATVENGFNPTFPYAITTRKTANKADEKSQSLKGYVKHYQVYSEGYDSHWRDVAVVKQKGDTYYRVSNCPSINVQCKEVDWEATQDYQGLKTTKD